MNSNNQDDPQQNHTSIKHIVDDHEEEKRKKQESMAAASYSKESGPSSMTIEAPTMPEFATETEDSVEEEANAEELDEYIEEVDTQKIKLSDDMKRAGLKTAGDTKFPSSFQNIKLPLSDEKIMYGHKAPVTQSVRWLAEFCLFCLKKAHLGLKVVHGHVVRVLQR